MICSHCKKGIAEDSKFCEFCGVKIGAVISSPSAGNTKISLGDLYKKTYAEMYENKALEATASSRDAISDRKNLVENVSHSNQKTDSWHLRLRNVILMLVVPVGWTVVFVSDGGESQYIPILLLLIASSDLAVWILYKAILYVIYGSKKNSF